MDAGNMPVAYLDENKLKEAIRIINEICQEGVDLGSAGMCPPMFGGSTAEEWAEEWEMLRNHIMRFLGQKE